MSNFSCNNYFADFVEEDFYKSGIPDYRCRTYINQGYIQIENDGYKIIHCHRFDLVMGNVDCSDT